LESHPRPPDQESYLDESVCETKPDNQCTNYSRAAQLLSRCTVRRCTSSKGNAIACFYERSRSLRSTRAGTNYRREVSNQLQPRQKTEGDSQLMIVFPPRGRHPRLFLGRQSFVSIDRDHYKMVGPSTRALLFEIAYDLDNCGRYWIHQL
jgi:hypothetical protein